ncbi:hypothetical protein OUZ56_008371 [Daphnia magna]|uniref:Uncharacterized protein n=1 Tax=Daphnia magna TaxID=35525 RepID=A0ABR0ACT1_9CRUS|nr:hypothetical protein OUZ56_008371 [Daphnia magna]
MNRSSVSHVADTLDGDVSSELLILKLLWGRTTSSMESIRVLLYPTTETKGHRKYQMSTAAQSHQQLSSLAVATDYSFALSSI